MKDWVVAPMNIVPQDLERVDLSALSAFMSKPPTSDTGVKFSHISIASSDVVFSFDWLSITVWGVPQAQTFLRLLNVDPDALVDLERGTAGFRVSYAGIHGLRLNCDPIQVSNHGSYCQVVLPGSFLDTITPTELFFALDFFYCTETRWQVSRLDLALDTQIFHAMDVTEEIKNGRFQSFVKKNNPDSFRVYKSALDGRDQPYTQNVGSRTSEKFLRVYNKQEENHFNNEWFTRVELELHGKTAYMALLDLMAAGVDLLPARSIGMVRGLIEFEADFWQKFCTGTFKIRMVFRAAAASVQRLVRYISKQVMPSLSLYLDIFAWGEPEALREELAVARRRWSKNHHLVLHEACTAFGNVEF